MIGYLHHLLFDPLSAWEQLKITAIAAPIALAVFMMLALSLERKK